MSVDPTRYPRREFLGQCAAVPLTAQLLAAAEPASNSATADPTSLLKVPKLSEAELAKEVESLLKLVDPSVIYQYVPLADDQNAWPLWEQAGKALVEEPNDDEYQEGLDAFVDKGMVPAPDVLERIIGWAERNEKARMLTDEGIARGALELPRAKKPIRLSLPMDEMSLWRKLAQLKALFVRVHLYRGDTTKAAREATSLLEMGSILIHSECLVVDYLVGLAVMGIGAEAAYCAATAPGVSDKQARAAIRSLASAKPNKEDFKRALRVEFCRWFLPHIAGFPAKASAIELATHHVVDQFEGELKPTKRQLEEYDRCIRQIAALLEGHQRPFDKQATVRLGSDLHVRFFAELDKPWLARNRKLLDPVQKEIAAWPKEIEPDIWEIIGLGDNPDPARKLTENDLRRAREALGNVDNVLGKYMIVQGLSTVMTFGVEMQQARLEARRIKIGLHLYENKHGLLPSQLNALVEDKLLQDIPTDPYDGTPFKYSPQRRVIWSVGDEGKNEGLVPEKHDRKNPFDEDQELTWRISKS